MRCATLVSLVLRRSLICLGTYLGIGLCLPAAVHAEAQVGAPLTSHVLDEANYISDRLEAEIGSSFRTLAETRDWSLLFVTVNDTGVFDPDTYLRAVMRRHTVEQSQAYSEQLGILVMPNEQRWQFYGSAGLMAAVPPGKQEAIWSQIIAPHMARNQHDEAMRLGLNAVLRSLVGLPWAENAPTSLVGLIDTQVLGRLPSLQAMFKALCFSLLGLGVWIVLCQVSFLRLRRVLQTQSTNKTANISVAHLNWGQNVGHGKAVSAWRWSDVLWPYVEAPDEGVSRAYRDSEGMLRFVCAQRSWAQVVTPWADLLALALVISCITAGLASGLVFHVSWMLIGLAGAGAFVLVYLTRLAAFLSLPLWPLHRREAMVTQAASEAVSRMLKGEQVRPATRVVVALMPGLQAGCMAFTGQVAVSGAAMQAVADTFEEDLRDKDQALALRALIYSLEKYLLHSRLTRQRTPQNDAEVQNANYRLAPQHVAQLVG